MKVRGIAKIRNEAHIIQATLDNWAQYCDAIHIYDDCSDDDTVDICRSHPAVVEVLSSNLFDPDRERAEWFNRQAVLSSAQRFLEMGEDWVVYFDGDEHLYNFDISKLSDPSVNAVACRSYDAYITPDDKEAHWSEREYVGPEYEFCWYFYRNGPHLRFHLPDQRSMYMGPLAGKIQEGDIIHYGKGISVEAYERKCDYYADVFGPKYSKKWAARRGSAVHDDWHSDFGNPLVKWRDIFDGSAGVHHRGKDRLVR